MTEGSILAVTGIVLAGISILLFYLLVKSVLDERRSSGVRKTWANFGLSIAFASLFLI